MKIVDSYPHKVREIRHTTFTLPDGCKLAARIWMPKDAGDNPVPAILEYLPYRKNDLMIERDLSMQPYLAGHGYAVIRLDLRGAGDSEGLMVDEYTAQEIQDGHDVIAVIADQPWCDGNVAMIGISWGGFNGLQIAATRPPALKCIITLCSTDDRYADDVHYMGGSLIYEQLGWSSVMFSLNTLPPDPANVGDKWREMWLERLDGSGLWIKNWMEHQTRDAFWKHGSVCEDWSRIEIPVYAVSGWADGYCRSVFRLMENLQGPKKGIVGPWAHRYPHIGQPGPAVNFLQEEIRWFDHWMKGKDTGIMDEPQLRLYIQDGVPPKGWYKDRPGRWIAEPAWPSPHTKRTDFHLCADGSLSTDRPGSGAVLSHASPADLGMAAGQWCGYSNPGDAPLDQRKDDGGSLCFETEPLAEDLDMAGDARVKLRIAADRPVAQVIARICDVDPDGRSTRVSYGVLNLNHRNSHEFPEPLEPGTFYDVVVDMKHVGQKFAAGHRLRLALSTNYFPTVWPTPEAVRIQVDTAASALELPLRGIEPADATLPIFGPAEGSPPPAIDRIEPAEVYFRVVEDAINDRTELQMADGSGVWRIQDIDLTVRDQGYGTYGVPNGDVTAAIGRTENIHGFSRGDWSMRSKTETTLTGNRTDFIITARMQVWEGDEKIRDVTWDEKIPRNFT